MALVLDGGLLPPVLVLGEALPNLKGSSSLSSLLALLRTKPFGYSPSTRKSVTCLTLGKLLAPQGPTIHRWTGMACEAVRTLPGHLCVPGTSISHSITCADTDLLVSSGIVQLGLAVSLRAGTALGAVGQSAEFCFSKAWSEFISVKQDGYLF